MGLNMLYGGVWSCTKISTGGGGDLNIFEGKQLGLGHGKSRECWGLVKSNLQSGAGTNSYNTRNSLEISTVYL